MREVLRKAVLVATFLLAGCNTYHRQALEPLRAQQIEKNLAGQSGWLSKDLERQILALNPTNVSARDISEVLSRAPAPRIINIHGGVFWVIPRMVSFSEFLIGMGYPALSLTNPSDGTYSLSCYDSSEQIAGMVAWFYEREGLRPILVGHSQGGMQVVKVLRHLAAKPPAQLHVWDPLIWKELGRCEFIDPLTGRSRPVVGLQLAYATSVGAGGLTRVLPNQWDMSLTLHSIPDSVEEFTGFCKTKDLFGGDYLGYGSANHYVAEGKAAVRNVWLPSEYKHGSIPDTQHLLKSQAIKDWINSYHPASEPISTPTLDVQFDADSRHILWAADVWYSLKKHWVLELQRLIQAKYSPQHVS